MMPNDNNIIIMMIISFVNTRSGTIVVIRFATEAT